MIQFFGMTQSNGRNMEVKMRLRAWTAFIKSALFIAAVHRHGVDLPRCLPAVDDFELRLPSFASCVHTRAARPPVARRPALAR